MNQSNSLQELLVLHCNTYPKLEIEDIFKFLYQSSFGCEHMVKSDELVVENIKQEAAKKHSNNVLVEKLGGSYSRVYLDYLNKGLDAQTLGKLFYLSAKCEKAGNDVLKKNIEVVKQMVKQGDLPFEWDHFEQKLKLWEDSGYQPLHHSETYKNEYNPAYRVISDDYIPFLPALAKIDSKLKEGDVILAIEGKCASGKSTFADALEKMYDCNVFRMDDFFLTPSQRTVKRLAETGGNVDRERFLEEVLIPLKHKEVVNYRRFNCSTLKFENPDLKLLKKLTIIEGVYCMHPELESYYNLSVFLDISADLQKERIKKRNSEQMAQRFFEEWIPLEERYFKEFDIKTHCDMKVFIG